MSYDQPDTGEPDTDDKAAPAGGSSTLDDHALLALVAGERQASISLDTDAELLAAREKALNYFKGEMPDIPALKGRSSAVSTDIADAVHTIMPDLVEIFTGGDDVATFTPRGPQDEAAAQQETDYVHHVVFQQNDGFLTLQTAMQDALLSKIGVFKFWREDSEDREEQTVEGKTGVEIQMAMHDGWTVESHQPSQAQAAQPPAPPPGPPGAPPQPQQPPEPLFDAVLVKTKPQSKTLIMAVPPEDFAVAKDTVKLRETTYCSMRTRPRALELLKQGYDEALVDKLPVCPDEDTHGLDQARDTAGEREVSTGSVSRDYRRVEVIEHYLKCFDDDRVYYHRVVTGGDESVLLLREEAEVVPFAAITPYLVTHRFFGRSVADLLLQVQQIRTVLTRLMLDSGYFALNQRMEVSEAELTDTTIDDLLDNVPNRPVITKTGNGLKPLQAAALSFNAFEALEYTATLGEQRTGVVRNAQGLNPDTLHDTAQGALALMSAAQKRVRMIARVFAETGIKDLFLGVHDLLRSGPAQPAVFRLRGKWVDVDPTRWGVRDDMDISIGVGAGGREHDTAAMQQVLAIQAQVGQNPGLHGMVTPQNVYNAIDRLLQRNGLQGVGRFFTEPPPPPPPGTPMPPPAPPPPNPDMVKVQARAQLDQQKAGADHALNLQKAGTSAQLQQAKMQNDAELARYKADQAAALKQYEMQLDAHLEQQRIASAAQAQLAAPPVHVGGYVG